jgi:hypothetical protein
MSRFSLRCVAHIRHATPSNGSRTQSNLPIKQPAVVYSTTSIRVRRMTLTSTVYWLYWATCLLRSHSWPIWGSEGGLRQISCWRRGALTDMLSVTNLPKKSMNRSISLSVESEFVKQDPDALPLLAILSLLPAGTITQNLRWWATSVKVIPSAIATLFDAGLLVENIREHSVSPILFVVPSSSQLCSSKTRSQRRSGGRYNRRAVNMS